MSEDAAAATAAAVS